MLHKISENLQVCSTEASLPKKISIQNTPNWSSCSQLWIYFYITNKMAKHKFQWGFPFKKLNTKMFGETLWEKKWKLFIMFLCYVAADKNHINLFAVLYEILHIVRKTYNAFKILWKLEFLIDFLFKIIYGINFGNFR
jgi:hypothetical protein